MPSSFSQRLDDFKKDLEEECSIEQLQDMCNDILDAINEASDEERSKLVEILEERGSGYSTCGESIKTNADKDDDVKAAAIEYYKKACLLYECIDKCLRDDEDEQKNNNYPVILDICYEIWELSNKTEDKFINKSVFYCDKILQKNIPIEYFDKKLLYLFGCCYYDAAKYFFLNSREEQKESYTNASLFLQKFVIQALKSAQKNPDASLETAQYFLGLSYYNLDEYDRAIKHLMVSAERKGAKTSRSAQLYFSKICMEQSMKQHLTLAYQYSLSMESDKDEPILERLSWYLQGYYFYAYNRSSAPQSSDYAKAKQYFEQSAAITDGCFGYLEASRMLVRGYMENRLPVANVTEQISRLTQQLIYMELQGEEEATKFLQSLKEGKPINASTREFPILFTPKKLLPDRFLLATRKSLAVPKRSHNESKYFVGDDVFPSIAPKQLNYSTSSISSSLERSEKQSANSFQQRSKVEYSHHPSSSEPYEEGQIVDLKNEINSEDGICNSHLSSIAAQSPRQEGHKFNHSGDGSNFRTSTQYSDKIDSRKETVCDRSLKKSFTPVVSSIAQSPYTKKPYYAREESSEKQQDVSISQIHHSDFTISYSPIEEPSEKLSRSITSPLPSSIRLNDSLDVPHSPPYSETSSKHSSEIAIIPCSKNDLRLSSALQSPNFEVASKKSVTPIGGSPNYLSDSTELVVSAQPHNSDIQDARDTDKSADNKHLTKFGRESSIESRKPSPRKISVPDRKSTTNNLELKQSVAKEQKKESSTAKIQLRPTNQFMYSGNAFADLYNAYLVNQEYYQNGVHASQKKNAYFENRRPTNRNKNTRTQQENNIQQITSSLIILTREDNADFSQNTEPMELVKKINYLLSSIGLETCQPHKYRSMCIAKSLMLNLSARNVRKILPYCRPVPAHIENSEMIYQDIKLLLEAYPPLEKYQVFFNTSSKLPPIPVDENHSLIILIGAMLTYITLTCEINNQYFQGGLTILEGYYNRPAQLPLTCHTSSP